MKSGEKCLEDTYTTLGHSKRKKLKNLTPTGIMLDVRQGSLQTS